MEQILDVLRGSTIAEERGEDVESKFWATYKKVSYDNDFLERANDDMAIILTFVRLFQCIRKCEANGSARLVYSPLSTLPSS